MTKDLQLYVNVPFTPRRDTWRAGQAWLYDQTVVRGYGIALKRELEAAAEGLEDYTVRSLYFGGGIPAMATARVLREALAIVRKCFPAAPDMDFQLAVQPSNLTEVLCMGMAHDGLTHLVCRLDTVNRAEWELLALPYDYDPSLERMDAALKERRPPHLTMRALYGVPDQTEARLSTTLARLLAYKPDCVRLEPGWPAPGTALARECEAGRHHDLSPEERQALLESAEGTLLDAGYRRYSLREYALPGRENRFELDRLRDIDRLGLGAGAASHYDGVFYTNTADLVKYLDHSAELDVIAENIAAPAADALARRRALLDLTAPAGLSPSGAPAAFLETQLAAGNLRQAGEGYVLTPRGILHWDEIRL